MKWINLLIALIGMLMIGCATGSALNPFNSGFKCATTDTGECIPLNEAYDRALEEDKGKKPSVALVVKGDNGKSESMYKKALYREVTNLLDKPKTPLVLPPKTVRVLILPYKDSTNTLYMQRYLYFFASQPEWVLDVDGIDER